MSQGVVAARRCAVIVAVGAVVALNAACQRKPALPPLGAEAAERTPPRPAAGPPAFVGRWAVSQALCSDHAWVLTTGMMQSPSVLSCNFDKVDPSDAGYSVYSTCKVGKAFAPGRLLFTLTGQGASRSLTVNGGPFTEPMALVRCPGQAATALQASNRTFQGG